MEQYGFEKAIAIIEWRHEKKGHSDIYVITEKYL